MIWWLIIGLGSAWLFWDMHVRDWLGLGNGALDLLGDTPKYIRNGRINDSLSAEEKREIAKQLESWLEEEARRNKSIYRGGSAPW